MILKNIFKKQRLLIELIFFIIPSIIIIFLKNELITSLLIVIFIGLFFTLFDYEPKEWKLLVLGLILSLISELGGDYFFKLQTWTQGSLFGIPLWLPILWAYEFVFIRRIGNSIIKSRQKK